MRSRLYTLLWLVGELLALFTATNLFAYVLAPGVEFLRGVHPPIGGVAWWPWQLVEWAIAWHVSGSHYAVAFGVFGTLSVLWTIAVIVAYQRRRAKATGDFGSARWASTRELRERGLLESPRGLVLGQTNEAQWHIPRRGRLVLSRWRMRRRGRLITTTRGHTLVVASTGRGKGASCIIPTLYRDPGSVVVHDTKGELWQQTSGFRSQFSYCIRFEPADRTTARWNPLLELPMGTAVIPAVQNVAEIIANPYGRAAGTSTGNAEFFDNTSKRLLSAAIVHVLYASTGTERSFGGVYRLLNHPERSFYDTLDFLLSYEHGDPGIDRFVRQEARGALNAGADLLGSLQQTMSTQLKVFSDPQIQDATARSDFMLDDIANARRPVSVYLIASLDDQDRLAPLKSLFLQMLSRHYTRDHARSARHDVHHIYDEFPALGRMESVETQLALARGYGMRYTIVTQTLAQIHKLYGRETSIMANCDTHLVLGTNEHHEARAIAEALGKRTVLKTTESRSGGMGDILHQSRSVSNSETGVDLFLPDDVLRLEYDEVIILQGGYAPYRARKILYFLDRRFKVARERQALTRDQESRWLPPPRSSVWDEVRPQDQAGDHADIPPAELPAPSSMSGEAEPRTGESEAPSERDIEPVIPPTELSADDPRNLVNL